jgi:hypothetical protein
MKKNGARDKDKKVDKIIELFYDKLKNNQE